MTNSSGLLVTFGEAMAVLRADTIGALDRGAAMRLSVAGSESNVAVGVARLGGRATFIGRVGADSLGVMIESSLRGAGVNTRILRDPDRPTGLMLVEQRLHDVRRVQYYRTGSAASAFSPHDVTAEHICDAALLHVTGITMMLSDSAASTVTSAVEDAAASGVAVSLDLNYRSALATPAQFREAVAPVISKANILFGGLDEARIVLDESERTEAAALVEMLANHGPGEVILTDGSHGAWAHLAGQPYRQQAVPIFAVDPIGAGDAFVSGYLAARLAGLPEQQRLTQAATVAAICVASNGDWEGMPRLDELALVGADSGMVRR